jgi:NAD(P)-dependent dehydrogenase (short-subunit alcohol dehydrogenase family)
MGVLEGKVVLITGGGNGIGRECALIAAREGAKVVVNDLGGSLTGGDEGDAGPAEAVAQEICAAGGQAVSNSESVTNYAAVQGMVKQALDAFGGLHAVINPAGILRDGMFHKMSEADWDSVIAVHMRGTFNVCRATIELFREQQDGAYVLFTSTSGLLGNIGQANYGAAKMGIAGLSRIIAMEGAAKNVRSNVIAPVAWTRMTQSVPVKDEAAAERRKVMAEKIRADQPAILSVALRPNLRRPGRRHPALQPAAPDHEPQQGGGLDARHRHFRMLSADAREVLFAHPQPPDGRPGAGAGVLTSQSRRRGHPASAASAAPSRRRVIHSVFAAAPRLS